MKYIEEPKLAELSNWITGKELGDKVLTCRIESFTCELYPSCRTETHVSKR